MPIANLKDAGALDFAALRDLPETAVAELIRPSGTESKGMEIR